MALPRAVCALAALSGLVLACAPAAVKPAASTAPPPPTVLVRPRPPPAVTPAASTAPPPPTTSSVASAPNTALDSPVTAAPSPPACGDGATLMAGMSTRDKLAQLLMVGVRNGADTRAVVANYHVGGVMIGGWTDLSMLSDGSLTDIGGSVGGVRNGADTRAVVENYHVGGVMIGGWTDLSMLSDGSLTDIAGSAGPLPLGGRRDENGGRGPRAGTPARGAA